MRKMTFSLDDEVALEIDRAAERLRIPKSQVVREAVALYGEQIGRLTEAEKTRRLAAFDRLVPDLPSRDRTEIDTEQAEVRAARRGGGRRSVKP